MVPDIHTPPENGEHPLALPALLALITLAILGYASYTLYDIYHDREYNQAGIVDTTQESRVN
ncbi:MAG: hypothetical protein GC137_08890 [Alphaproteobacteria bacterium]|nr:hypothetical protein [Alphaproteobacteria bacterium]